MNDSQVKQQIQQMVSFIQQEANDKANEIKVKAEEDFNIRKLGAVEAARERIRAEYEKKVKAIDVNRKIAQSTEQNAARLQVLKARDGVLRESVEEAASKLASISTDDPVAYKKLVNRLILQGLIVLSDTTVIVRCRSQDVEAVEEMLPSISDDYVAKTNLPVTITVDTESFLPETCTGGVILLSRGGTISVENTFESRLEIAYQQNLPTIRKILFGNP